MVNFKIEASTFETLSDSLKAEYKKEGSMYVLDVQGVEQHPSFTNMKTAKDKEVIISKEAKSKLADSVKEVSNLNKIIKDGPSEENIKSLRDEYENKAVKQKAKYDKLDSDFKEHRIGNLTKDKATKIVDENFNVTGMQRDFYIDNIKQRMTVEDVEGGKAIVRVLNSDGTPSAKSISDLTKEYVDNKDNKGIVKGSKASGSSLPTNDSRSTDLNPQNSNTDGKFDMSNASEEQLVAHMGNMLKDD